MSEPRHWKKHWETRCILCDYNSQSYRARWIPRIIAIWHTLRHHPYGYMVITAVDGYAKQKVSGKNA